MLLKTVDRKLDELKTGTNLSTRTVAAMGLRIENLSHFLWNSGRQMGGQDHFKDLARVKEKLSWKVTSLKQADISFDNLDFGDVLTDHGHVNVQDSLQIQNWVLITVYEDIRIRRLNARKASAVRCIITILPMRNQGH